MLGASRDHAGNADIGPNGYFDRVFKGRLRGLPGNADAPMSVAQLWVPGGVEHDCCKGILDACSE